MTVLAARLARGQILAARQHPLAPQPPPLPLPPSPHRRPTGS
jgi:hypothetical protein